MEILINTGTQQYPITIEKLTAINLCDKRILIVSSQVVAELHLNALLGIIQAQSVHTCILQDGEEYKNMQSIEKVLECAFQAKLNRNSLMIALGGGVITDMVGFASGIYQRGIDFISIPTTLLAMVDASVGGKCGVNNAYGKNLIGLFHQPKHVFVDSSFLQTLPEREFRAGLAEIIKIFACFDFARLQDFDIKNLSYYIQRSIELKALVVEQDEKENKNIRALLNYGHTFAHAIELEGNFKEYLHGEAVSLGIIMANRLANKLGILTKEIEILIFNILKACCLPVHYTIRDKEAFYQSFFFDKKSLDSKLHFILLESQNDIKARVHDDIPEDLIREVLCEFL